jgi:serine/threonine-protein kinase HipA
MKKITAEKDFLLIERFDSAQTGRGRQRKSMVSALKLLGLDEMMARYAELAKVAGDMRKHLQKNG